MVFRPDQGLLGIFFCEDWNIRVGYLGLDAFEVCFAQGKDVLESIFVVVFTHDNPWFSIGMRFRQAGNVYEEAVVDTDESSIDDLVR